MALLIIIHAFICVFLVAVILIQPGKGDAGIGFGSSSQTIFGSKGAGNFLTKTTSACALVFIVTSFFLTRSRIADTTGSVIKPGRGKQSEAPAKPATPAPVKGEAPKAGEPAKAAAPSATPGKQEAAPTKK